MRRAIKKLTLLFLVGCCTLMGYLLLLKNNAPFTVVSAQEVTENVRTHDSI